MFRRAVLIGTGIALLGLYAPDYAEQTLQAPAFTLEASHQRTAALAPVPSTLANPKQIERLVTSQVGQVAPPAMQTNEAEDSGIDQCVALYIHIVAPENPNWNERDPRWEPMRQAIARDCARRREDRIKVVQPKLERMYRDALAQSDARHLSRADAVVLIEFYATDTGRRFLAFQSRMAAIESSVLRQLFMSRSPMNKAAPPPALAPEVLKRRATLLLMSREISAIQQWQDDAAHTGDDTSGGTVGPVLINMTAAFEGGAIDQVDREFAVDMPAFTAFLSLPAEKHEIRVFADALKAFQKASASTFLELAPQSNGDLQKWRDEYRALPVPHGGSPASAPSPK
ncbi:hypothetical protein [Trinickia dinghuensis]|uniref:DUF2059 domain-containing protein n=1 Tax=Trinickia dinghuensis TaxID=2291023 RepID=A0A3D8JWU4_9BURK|nr:hypothetical protein [Trinickia dinghuensis]RDU97613.1 hypothetical protein DWV00_17195 [Trinickia dinghuensis]